MKSVVSTLAAALVGAALMVTPQVASAANLSGSWNVSGTVTVNDRLVFTATPVCVFQQAGAQLTGTCKGPNSLGPATGTVNGSRVAVRLNVVPYTAAGFRGSIALSGTLGPDGVIRGAMIVSSMPRQVGVFTALRR